jgi:hypothetical protein
MKDRSSLAAALAPLAIVPVAAVGVLTMRVSMPQVTLGWPGAVLLAALSVLFAYLIMFLAALPMHRRLQQRQVASAVPYVALGAFTGAVPFAVYLVIIAAGVWPAAAGREGAAFGVMIGTLGVPAGVAVATIFWSMAVRHPQND